MTWWRRIFGGGRTAQERLFAHLRAKEAELQTLTDALPQLIWSADAQGRRDYCNARWFEYTGLTEEESFGEAWLHALHPADTARVREAWNHARTTGTPYEFEARLRSRTGQYRWFMARALPVHDDEGHLTRWLGTVTDIHHHRILEEQQQRSQRSLRLLAEVGTALSEETLQRGIVARVLDILVHEFCDWAYIAVSEQDGYRVAGVVHRNPAQQAFAAMFSGMFVREPCLTGDYKESLHVLGTATTLSVPLIVGGKSMGLLHCAWSAATTVEEDKADLLREIGLRCAAALDRARVHESLVTTLQSVFIEQRLPRLNNVGFSAVYLPATRGALIGGDWYDALELPDGRVFIAIGDVGGHGLDAAIAMNRARQAMFVSAAALPDPSAVLDRVHEVLELTHSPMATALCGFLDPSTFTFTYASAGHSPPVLAVAHGDAHFLRVDGAPLGIGFAPGARTFSETLPPESLLVFYTDGLTEARRDLLAGERRLLDVAAQVHGSFSFAPAEAIRHAMLEGAETRDDIAILALSFGSPKAPVMPPFPENIRLS